MFAELLARSCFSFLRGASQPEEHVLAAKERGLDAIAIVDRMGLYGSVRAHAQARESDLRCITGAELVLDPEELGRVEPRRKKTQTANEARLLALSDAPSVVLLAQDHEGYSNLCRLLTLSHADQLKKEGALRLEWLARHHAGLIAIVPSPRDPDGPDAAPDVLLSTLRDVFEERAFLATHRHLDVFDRARLRSVEEKSARFGLPVVASGRPLFHHRSRKPLADVLCCIREGITLDRAGTALDSNGEAFLRSELEMQKLFREHLDWVERTAEVASACNFSLAELRYHFPCELAPGETADDKLRRLTEDGIVRRYPNGIPTSVRTQIEKELVLIEQLSVAPYFLSTWEVVEIAREKKILCQGRGSAANSAVCYALGITAVDPARSNLLFERFMSAERSEPPDIDIDFEHERREEVIQELYARHGRDRAAMVSEVICYRGKSALRETGKAFGLSLEQIDRLSNTITHWDSAEVSDSRLVEMGFDPRDTRLRQSVTLARTLEGFPRHLSIHVGGFVLSARPLHEVAPVEPARMPNRTVIPWDKDDIETLGFFKIDVLGLGMLTAIRKCLELIHRDGALHACPIDELERTNEVALEASSTHLRITDEISEIKSSCPPSSALDTSELSNSNEIEASCPPSSVLVASLLRAAGPPQIGRSEAASGRDTLLCTSGFEGSASARCIHGRHFSTLASTRPWSPTSNRRSRTHVGLTGWSVRARADDALRDTRRNATGRGEEDPGKSPTEDLKALGIGASRDLHFFIPANASIPARRVFVLGDPALAEFTRAGAGNMQADAHVGVGITRGSYERELGDDVSHVRSGSFTRENTARDDEDSAVAEFTRGAAGNMQVAADLGVTLENFEHELERADGFRAIAAHRDAHVGVGITRESSERERDIDVSQVRTGSFTRENTARRDEDSAIAEITRAGAGHLQANAAHPDAHVDRAAHVGITRENYERERDVDVSLVRSGSFTRENIARDDGFFSQCSPCTLAEGCRGAGGCRVDVLPRMSSLRVQKREWFQVRLQTPGACRFVEHSSSREMLDVEEGFESMARRLRAANDVEDSSDELELELALALGKGEELFDPLDVITRIPPEDPAVYDMACRADTVGVFQIESRAQMSMLPRLKPRSFYDLVVEVAIVRPGPIQGGMVHPYLRRRNKEEAITSPHPDLWPILERTLGVPLFQEQVMQISITGAGYTGGEADQLRRDMAAWKKSGKLLRHKSRLLEGFAKKGISAEFGEALFEQIKGFGDYGFPESHASSFALLVYASTWQKAHYPAHFACALINSQPMGFYSPSTILQDAQRHGVEVLDVDVSKSDWDCTLEGGALRIGFRLVKGFSEKAARRVEEARREAELTSLDDLSRRARLHKDELEMLGEAGALEPLVRGRRNALWQARAPRVGGLFAKTDVAEPTVELPPLRAAEQLLLDYGRKGLSVGDHPMRHLRPGLAERGVLNAKELLTAKQGSRVEVAGLVICRQQPGTASGVVFITLEDEAGFVNLVLWNRVYERLRLVARHSTLLLARGVIERQTEEVNEPIVHVIVDDLERLDVPGKNLASRSRDFH